MKLEFFKSDNENGVLTVTFDRPPVNAFSYETYRELLMLCDRIEFDDEVRVVVITSPRNGKAWIGGADVKDFVPLTYETRLERYKLVTSALGALSKLSRPIIASINNHCIGMGVSFASICDMRVAADDIFFAKPEIDRGLVAAGGAPFNRINFPFAKSREMIFTGRRFTTAELKETGFFNYVVPRADVLEKSMEIARQIAKRSLPAIKANKICNAAVETMPYLEAYKFTQEYAAKLTAGSDAKEGIKAFLERRDPDYSDNR